MDTMVVWWVLNTHYIDSIQVYMYVHLVQGMLSICNQYIEALHGSHFVGQLPGEQK